MNTKGTCTQPPLQTVEFYPPCTSPSLPLQGAHGLIPHSASPFHLRFRMRQVNVVGASPLSQPSRVIQTLQAPPDVAPSSVSVRTASESSLRMRWVVRWGWMDGWVQGWAAGSWGAARSLGAVCSLGMLFPRVQHEADGKIISFFQNSRKSETYLKCLINHLNCLLPLPLPLHQGNICLCVKPWLLRLQFHRLGQCVGQKYNAGANLQFPGAQLFVLSKTVPRRYTGAIDSHSTGTERFKDGKVCTLHSCRKIDVGKSVGLCDKI